MKTRSCRIGLGSMLALGMALAMGCGGVDDATTPDMVEPGRETAAPEEVATTEQALTVFYGTHNHGGDLFPGEYEILMGGACGGDYVRNFFNVWNVGNGSCSAIGWASPDARDCRVRVRINRSGGYANGTCHVQVDASSLADICGAHDKCATGTKLHPLCSSVVSAVCAADSFCCNNSWDNVCVNKVFSVGNSLACVRNSCSHTLCTQGGPLTSGCDSPTVSPSCVSRICAADPYCCNNAWDSACVNAVSSVCGKTCN